MKIDFHKLWQGTLCILVLCAIGFVLFFSPSHQRSAIAQAKLSDLKTRSNQLPKLDAKKRKFIHFLLPAIYRTNQKILAKRQHIERIYHSVQKGRSVSTNETLWLLHTAKNYKLKSFQISNRESWEQLLSRVDIVPPSLALAQAINESAWGSSRFAREANNYYGLWCYTKGCGLAPKRRAPGRVNQVRKFRNATASVQAYIHNLNTNRHYAALRTIRSQERAEHRPISPLKLAEGLSMYSTRRGQYVQTIKNIITHYHLNKLAQLDRPITKSKGPS